MLLALDIDLVIQGHFVAVHAAESPIAGRTFIYANFDVLVGNADLFLNAVEQQTDEFFLGGGLPAGDHADFDNRVGVGPAGWREQVVFFHRKKPVRSFILRKLQRFHHTLMNHIGQWPFDGVEMVFDAVYFDLCHFDDLTIDMLDFTIALQTSIH